MLRDKELKDLPRKHTVKRFTGVEIGYTFAMKRIFNSLLAVWYIAILWASTIFVLGYWFRIAEFSACRSPSSSHPRACRLVLAACSLECLVGASSLVRAGSDRARASQARHLAG